MMSRILCDMSFRELEEKNIGQKLLQALKTEIEVNDEYSRALSMATNDARNVELSYSTARKLLEKVLSDETDCSDKL